jgi:hypothetical protein
MKVDLFYLSPNPYGGWVTYTCHLMEALESVGVEVNLFKIRPRSEKNKRKFGYDKEYRNITMVEALVRPTVKLIVAGAKQFKEQTKELYEFGNASIVIHDPTELKNMPQKLDPRRCVVIRKIGLKTLTDEDALRVREPTFIRHPYSCSEPAGEMPTNRLFNAVSTSRIDFDKHTEILLDANRLLEEHHQIDIRGFENRLYTKFKIVPKYPEWVQSKAHYPRERDYARRLMLDYKFNVDMTVIKGDGGGTQYTWLEAWSAGCIPIINIEWLLEEPDDMIPGYNCIAVAGAEELAEILQGKRNGAVITADKLRLLQQGGHSSLERHNAHMIGGEYLAFLTGQAV